MLESIMWSTPVLGIERVGIRLFLSFIIGALISSSYVLSVKKHCYSKSFAITLVILPVIVSTVITLVGSDIAKALSLGGVFALVRFRSVPGDAKEIVYVFFAMVAGLSIGVECFLIAYVFTIVVATAFVILSRLCFNGAKKDGVQLKLVLSEGAEASLNPIFLQYCVSWGVDKVRTVEAGLEVTYCVVLKDEKNQTQFVEALRAKIPSLTLTRKEPSPPSSSSQSLSPL